MQSEEEPLRAIIKVQPNGAVILPDWVWQALIKKAGLRSKKFRQIKKTVKKELEKLILAMPRSTDAI